MKPNRVFWGVLFLSFGVLLLLERLSSAPVHYVISWKFWPVLLVLWGVGMLVTKKAVRYGIAIFSAIFLATLVMSVFGGNWEEEREYDGVLASDQVLQEPFDDSVRHASFTLESGAGVFTLRDTSSDLMMARTTTSFGEYQLDRDRGEGLEAISLRYQGKKYGWRLGHMRNTANVRLHPAPVWDLRFEVGASRLDIDATPFNVASMHIDAGAAEVRVRLGDRADNTTVNVNTGASAVKIFVPATSGCEVTVSAPLSAKDFKGFEKIGRGLYRTPDYSAASKRVTIEIDAGVSSLKVVRY